jgi:malate dehydrogenase (oxaloacetate-decarboxylating)
LLIFLDAAEVNFEIALAVFDQAVEEGVAGVDIPKDERRKYAEERIWKPVYVDYEYDEGGMR